MEFRCYIYEDLESPEFFIGYCPTLNVMDYSTFSEEKVKEDLANVIELLFEYWEEKGILQEEILKLNFNEVDQHANILEYFTIKTR